MALERAEAYPLWYVEDLNNTRKLQATITSRRAVVGRVRRAPFQHPASNGSAIAADLFMNNPG